MKTDADASIATWTTENLAAREAARDFDEKWQEEVGEGALKKLEQYSGDVVRLTEKSKREQDLRERKLTEEQTALKAEIQRTLLGEEQKFQHTRAVSIEGLKKHLHELEEKGDAA